VSLLYFSLDIYHWLWQIGYDPCVILLLVRSWLACECVIVVKTAMWFTQFMYQNIFLTSNTFLLCIVLLQLLYVPFHLRITIIMHYILAVVHIWICSVVLFCESVSTSWRNEHTRQRNIYFRILKRCIGSSADMYMKLWKVCEQIRSCFKVVNIRCC